MRKVALVFVVAVFVPSLVLAWLAMRSLQDQQYLLERQQVLLYQHVTDTLAGGIRTRLNQASLDFGMQTEALFSSNNAALPNDGHNLFQHFTAAANATAVQFDRQLRQRWPLAEVGFGVTTAGIITCPQPADGVAAQRFLLDNRSFLGNRETAEVFLGRSWPYPFAVDDPAVDPGGYDSSPDFNAALQKNHNMVSSMKLPGFAAANQKYWLAKAQPRTVLPQDGNYPPAAGSSAPSSQNNLSRIVPVDTQFLSLIDLNQHGPTGSADGILARFIQNKLELIFWHRLRLEHNYIFGAELNLSRLLDTLRDLVWTEPPLGHEICLAVLDESAKPVLLSQPTFQAVWKRPLVATEIGGALPHWEVAAYLVDPTKLARAACTVELALGLLIAVLVLVIGAGSLLIVRCLNAELKLARQKTDFVSNVSHELKTPLTSIRMFSELLADGRVTDADKQRTYLNIISAEAARLTRLINNVLDFSRLESGEKSYCFQPCDLTAVARATAETFRPHLEANGFQFDCELPDLAVTVRGDADALAQILVNLLSNAEKYSGEQKTITLQVTRSDASPAHAEVRVLDRGSGVPSGSEEKIFEKFYRAHDSLSSGIQGSGLGLTLARQIARAHGGDLTCEPRPGGGSIFILRLPVTGETA